MPYYLTVYSRPNCRFEIQESETILEAAQRNGIDIPSSCESGICSTCCGKLYQGNISYRGKEIHGIDPDNDHHDILCCMAHAESDVVIDHPDIPPLYRAKPYSYQVIEHTHIQPQLIQLRLKAVEAKMPFIAGQYVELMDGDKRYPLSIASTPKDDFIELHIQTTANPDSSKRILELCQLNQTVTLQGPKGKAFWHESTQPVILVAGGAGYAPIKSVLMHLLHQQQTNPIVLYWGVRHSDFLYEDAELTALAQQHPHFKYIPVVSEKQDAWTGRTGLVHEAVLQDTHDFKNTMIYMAGPFAMSYVARDALVEKGAPLSHLYSDAFAFEKRSS